MPLAAGTRLGPYEVISLLGAGAMGEVYRARDLKLNRDVALKVLPESFADEPERLSRFRREAQVLASLNHPNIAHIHGLEESGPLHAIVMELVDGVTLEELIDRRYATWENPRTLQTTDQAGAVKSGGLPMVVTLAVVRQLAEALEVAHEQGIVHRDLKPSNVKVRDDGVVKVLDFGLARVLDSDNSVVMEAMNAPTMTAHETQFGAVLGTAAYMAPEQARGKAVDRRADIWAFGALTYEMLTGKRTFKGRSTSEIIDAVLHQDIDWAQLPADTPPRLVKLLRRCLERDPKRRLRDIGEARITLEALGAPRRRAGDQGEDRNRPVPDPVLREIDPIRVDTPAPDFKPIDRRRPTLQRGLWDMVTVTMVAAVLLLGQAYVASRPIGARLEALEYALLKQVLWSESDAAASWPKDDLRLPIVIDISPFRIDKAVATDRAKLDELIDTLRAMNAAAIGLDVDFSPDDAGNFMTPGDPLLFAKWTQYGNVRLGVFRREGDLPKRWLGRAEFQTLAAGIMLPQSEFGLAIQYVSPDLRLYPESITAQRDYLLQMPASLHEVTHPGTRSKLIENERLGRSNVENRIVLGKYPVDFSFAQYIEVLPYKEKGNLDLHASKIDRRVVLIGDMNDPADIRCTQVRAAPVPGVLLHASALATLNQGILEYVDDRRRLEDDVYLCVCALVTIWGFRRMATATALRDRLDAGAVDALAFATAAGVVFAAGAFLIGFWRVFWPDPLWLAATLLAVPYVKGIWSILLRGFRGTRSIDASPGGTIHVG